MIYSMTGYGRCENAASERKMTVELSSINHRYLDLNIRMPRILAPLEEEIRSLIKSKLSRGKVEVGILVQSTAEEDIEVDVNETLAAAYIRGLRSLAKDLNLEDDLKLSQLMALSDVVSVQKQTGDLEVIKTLLLKTLEGALDSLLEMRAKEGQVLKDDLLQKTNKLENLVSQVEKRSPEVVTNYRVKLGARLKVLLDAAPVDEARIATEVALFADKCAIDEEITRLKSHIVQLKNFLEASEPVGRKLDFLMQEMNREANTIGSKANDYLITQTVVELKNEIEKIREQIQNIE